MALAGFNASSHAVIPFIMIMYFMVSMLMPSVSAMILDWSGKDNKSECYSLLYLAGNIGSALGPVVAGFLFYSHMPWIFYSMSLAFLAMLPIIVFGVKDIYVPHPHRTSKGDQKQESLIKILFHNPILLIFILCLALLTLCYINLDFMLPLQFRDIFGLNAGSKYSSLIWTINGAVVVFCTPVIISFTKKKHPLYNIGIACLLYTLGFSLYGISESLAVLMFAVIIWTSGEILISTCAGIYIADQAPETHRGRSMSLYEFSRGVGKLTGPLFAGWLMTFFSYSRAWLIIAGICLIVDAIIWLLYKNS